jgi:hypothetical protein
MPDRCNDLMTRLRPPSGSPLCRTGITGGRVAESVSRAVSMLAGMENAWIGGDGRLIAGAEQLAFVWLSRPQERNQADKPKLARASAFGPRSSRAIDALGPSLRFARNLVSSRHSRGGGCLLGKTRRSSNLRSRLARSLIAHAHCGGKTSSVSSLRGGLRSKLNVSGVGGR